MIKKSTNHLNVIFKKDIINLTIKKGLNEQLISVTSTLLTYVHNTLNPLTYINDFDKPLLFVYYYTNSIRNILLNGKRKIYLYTCIENQCKVITYCKRYHLFYCIYNLK